MASNRETRAADDGTADAQAGDPITALAGFWARCFEESGRQAQAILEVMQGAGDSRQLHARWLDAVAASLDGFMRTPAFLEAMRRNLKAMTDLKVMQDQFVQGAARQVGAPLASDIGGLFERLHGDVHVILERLEAIEARLGAIEAKLKLGPP